MAWRFSPELTKHIINLAVDGIGVAFFAWMFDWVRKSFFGGSGKAIKSLRHGWTTFRLEMIEADIDRTVDCLERPHVCVARIIFGIFIALLGTTLFVGAVLIDFVTTYFPEKGDFTKLFSTLYMPGFVLQLMAIALVPMGTGLAMTEFSRLNTATARIDRLRKTKAKLEERIARRIGRE